MKENQLFFLLHPSLNEERVLRVIHDLGVDNPQKVSSVNDEKILKKLRNYPIAEYVREVINILEENIHSKGLLLLLGMEKKHSSIYRESYLGKTVEALMEEEKDIQGKKYQVGYTKTYVKVAVETTEDLSNRLVKGTAVELLNDEYLLLQR